MDNNLTSNDVKNGKYVEYHTNNSDIPLFMSEYKDGMKNGKWTIFFENGNIHIQCEYSDDMFHGLYQEFDQKGTLIKGGMYYQNIKIGFWLENNMKGKYNNTGEKEGLWLQRRFNFHKKISYTNGKIIKSEIFVE